MMIDPAAELGVSKKRTDGGREVVIYARGLLDLRAFFQ